MFLFFRVDPKRSRAKANQKRSRNKMQKKKKEKRSQRKNNQSKAAERWQSKQNRKAWESRTCICVDGYILHLTVSDHNSRQRSVSQTQITITLDRRQSKSSNRVGRSQSKSWQSGGVFFMLSKTKKKIKQSCINHVGVHVFRPRCLSSRRSDCSSSGRGRCQT